MTFKTKFCFSEWPRKNKHIPLLGRQHPLPNLREGVDTTYSGWLRFPNTTQIQVELDQKTISLACEFLSKMGRDKTKNCSYISDVPIDCVGSSKRENRKSSPQPPFEKAAFGKTHAENEKQVQLKCFQPWSGYTGPVYRALWNKQMKLIHV